MFCLRRCLRELLILEENVIYSTSPLFRFPQVFLAECAGPLIIYLMFYFRLPFIYSPKYDFTSSKHWVVQWVSACLVFSGGSVAMPHNSRRCADKPAIVPNTCGVWQQWGVRCNNHSTICNPCVMWRVLLQLGLHVSLLPLHQEDSGDNVCPSHLPWDHASQEHIQGEWVA